MAAPQVAPHIAAGTVAAVECCFGAAIYDPELAAMPGQPSMGVAYLANGAVAFMGSTTTAYGPVAENGQADLITRYFLKAVLQGASSGRALLQARQEFVSTIDASDPTDLKTLAQFLLLGDPSLCAVAEGAAGSIAFAGADVSATAAAKDRASRRKARRLAAKSDGAALAAAAKYAGREIDTRSAAVERVRQIAEKRGFSNAPKVFEVTGGPKFRAAAKALKRDEKVVVVIEQKPERGAVKAPAPALPSYRVLVAHILGDGITAVKEAESR